MEKIKAITNALHRKYNFHKILMIVLFFSNIYYLSYLLIIGFHNVIVVDDYWFMAEYKRHGLFGSIAWWYQNWQGRFSPQILTNFIVRMYELTGTLLPYTIFLIVVFIYSIFKIIKQLLPNQTKNYRDFRFLTFNYSIFLFNLFLIANFEFSTFYWINVSTMYFGGIAFFLIGTGELISKSKSIISYFLMFLGFGYAGSSAEHFGAICLFLIALYLISTIYQKRNKKFADTSNNLLTTKAWFALTMCVLSFLIMIFAPGNEIRREGYPQASIFNALVTGFKSLFYICTVLITEKAKYLIILSFPFIYLGALLRKDKVIDEFKTALIIAFSFPILILFLYICVLPSAYAISHIGPFRALTHIAFCIVLYIAFISFVIGYKTHFPKKMAFFLSLICCLFYIIISREGIKLKVPETIKYSQSEKKRISKLLLIKSNGNKKPITMDRLYSSSNNVLWHLELAKDSTTNYYWVNQWVSDGLELGFEVKVKPQ